MAFLEKDDMLANEVIKQTRAYLDYLEEHIENVRLAFIELSEKCDGMAWVGDDLSWHTLRSEVLAHDMSKFSKEEFAQYRAKFYPTQAESNNTKQLDIDFDKAWANHKLKNSHHHETMNSYTDLVHMVIDWLAMSYKFGDTPREYYESNLDEIKLDQKYIEELYEIFDRLEKSS